MKDNELMRNGSGYYDGTAFKAMTAAPKPGEIWTHNQSGAYMLVVANANGVCSTLRLNEQDKPGSILVMCRVPMYTNPIYLGYCFETNLNSYVKSVKSDEFNAVKRELVKVLGITTDDSYYKELEIKAADMLEEHQKLDKLKAEYDELMNESKALKCEMDALRCELEARDKAHELLSESFDKVSREADKAGIYKEMYMTLLDKVISARGCVNE